VCSLLPSSLLRTPSRAAWLPYLATHLLHRRVTLYPPSRLTQLTAPVPPAVAHRVLSHARTEVLLRCYRGATDATVPRQKVVAAVDAMGAAMRDLSKEMLR
jgi:hypothetical protein